MPTWTVRCCPVMFQTEHNLSKPAIEHNTAAIISIKDREQYSSFTRVDLQLPVYTF